MYQSALLESCKFIFAVRTLWLLVFVEVIVFHDCRHYYALLYHISQVLIYTQHSLTVKSVLEFLSLYQYTSFSSNVIFIC